jgi:hypothetical protein
MEDHPMTNTARMTEQEIRDAVKRMTMSEACKVALLAQALAGNKAARFTIYAKSR